MSCLNVKVEGLKHVVREQHTSRVACKNDLALLCMHTCSGSQLSCSVSGLCLCVLRDDSRSRLCTAVSRSTVCVSFSLDCSRLALLREGHGNRRLSFGQISRRCICCPASISRCCISLKTLHTVGGSHHAAGTTILSFVLLRGLHRHGWLRAGQIMKLFCVVAWSLTV